MIADKESEQCIGWMNCPGCDNAVHPPNRTDDSGQGYFVDGEDEKTCPNCKTISWVCIDDVPADPEEHQAYVATDWEKAS